MCWKCNFVSLLGGWSAVDNARLWTLARESGQTADAEKEDLHIFVMYLNILLHFIVYKSHVQIFKRISGFVK